MGWAKNRALEIEARGFDETGNQAVCLNCITDEALREETRKHLEEWECTFCGATADKDEGDEPIAAPFEDFMYIIMRAVHFHYRSVDDAGLPYDDGEYYGADVLDSNDVLHNVCGYDVTEKVFEAIDAAITDQLWTDETPPDKAMYWAWESFCDKVKHISRFVFLSTMEESSGHPDEFTAAEILAKLTGIIVSHGVMLHVPAGSEFWRGRMVDHPSKVGDYNNASTLGSPPKDAASNNRMSPAGISMFYGSDDIETVVAEIAAHDIRRYAVVGRFETVQDLDLLNLADLPPIPSCYTEEAPGVRYYELVFLHGFARELGKTVRLDGREHIEYVPTQVVTEYLRYIPDFNVDGILFRSAQNNGVNCVLFCDAEGCVDPDAPPRRPYESTPCLRLQPDTVQWVGVATRAVVGDDRIPWR